MKLIGVHTPQETTFAFKALKNQTPFKWEDASWVNDEADSVYCKERDIHVYIPNKEEGHKTYGVVLDLWKPEYRTIEIENLTEVINYINNKLFIKN